MDEAFLEFNTWLERIGYKHVYKTYHRRYNSNNSDNFVKEF